MTFEQILKSECCDAELRAVCVECLHGEPLKQSFIKYLQEQQEWVKNEYAKSDSQGESIAYLNVISKLQAQIKELESIKN